MPKQILLVDDSVTVGRIVEITFAHEDFVVTAVRSGDEALARARASAPDVVLTDAGLPGKSGYDLAAELRAAGVQAPLLLLTSNFAPYDEGRGRAAGIDGAMVKPFETQAMIDRVHQLMNQRAVGKASEHPTAAAPMAPPPRPAPSPAMAAAKAAPSPSAKPSGPPRATLMGLPSFNPVGAPSTPTAAGTVPGKPVPHPTFMGATPNTPVKEEPRPQAPQAVEARTVIDMEAPKLGTAAPAAEPPPHRPPSIPPPPTGRTTGPHAVIGSPHAATDGPKPPPPPSRTTGPHPVMAPPPPVRPAVAPSIVPPPVAKEPESRPAMRASEPHPVVPPPTPPIAAPAAPAAFAAPVAPSPVIEVAAASLPPAAVARAGSTEVTARLAVTGIPIDAPRMPRPPLIPNAPEPRPQSDPGVAYLGGPGPQRSPAPQPVIDAVVAAAREAVPRATEAALGGLASRGPEYEAIARLSREVIEQIAWEVVPQLAETIIHEHLDRLVKERAHS